MSHFAKVFEDRCVTVIRAESDFFDTFVDTSPGDWLQVSYNTRGNVHYLPDSNTPSGQPALRGNFPSAGWIYDRENDKFYPPQKYASWTIDPEIWLWKPPIPQPDDTGNWLWNESTQSWDPLAGPRP
jgi:hypothetical protein